jgi:hypothetical protein
VQGLTPLIVLFNESFQSGKFQPFFDALAMGLSAFVQGLTVAVQGAQWLGGVLMSWLPYVGPLLFGIAAALGTYLVVTRAVQIATQLWTAAQAVLNTVMSANPVLLITMLIVGLIMALLSLIATLQPVREFFANTFRALGNIVAGFVGSALDGLEWLVNGFIDGINVLIGAVNAVGEFVGINIPRLDRFDFSKIKQGWKQRITGTFDAVADATENFNIDQFKKMLGLEQLSAAKTDPNTDALAKWDASHGGFPIPGDKEKGISSIDRVGSVGKIEDTVDISSEELKLLRDLAELSSIQNFVTLTPTVQVTTGDIRHEADVDLIVGKIEQKLMQEIANSAQGVYA